MPIESKPEHDAPKLAWSTFLPGLLLAAAFALILLLALRPWAVLRMVAWTVTVAGMLLTLFGSYSLQGELFRHEPPHWSHQRRWAFVAIVVGGTAWTFGSIWLSE